MLLAFERENEVELLLSTGHTTVIKFDEIQTGFLEELKNCLFQPLERKPFRYKLIEEDSTATLVITYSVESLNMQVGSFTLTRSITFEQFLQRLEAYQLSLVTRLQESEANLSKVIKERDDGLVKLQDLGIAKEQHEMMMFKKFALVLNGLQVDPK